MRIEPEFFSIVVPYFRRPHYLKMLVNSIHKYADMPFEIIVHDDRGIDLSSLDVKDKVSTIILNTGLNLGLAPALNRAISVANSEYILRLDHDCIMTKPCLKAYTEVLKKPYVGVLAPMGDPHPITGPEYIQCDDGTKFTFMSGIADATMAVFRKSFWSEVGGFVDDVVSGCADTPIYYKSWKYGYFRAVVLEESSFRNLSAEKGNVDTTIGPYGDCHLPLIFNLPNYGKLCGRRMEYCQWNVDSHQKIPGDPISNLDYWHNYSTKVLPEEGVVSSINWEAAKKHGQDKWRKIIENERVFKSG